jgi:hypothetical protein
MNILSYEVSTQPGSRPDQFEEHLPGEGAARVMTHDTTMA